MIEIRKIEDTGNEVDYKLFIDGVLIDEADIDVNDDNGEERYDISTIDLKASNSITAHALSEFPALDHVMCWHNVSWLELIGQIQIDYNSKKQLFKAAILIGKLSRWRRQYSFRDYFLELRKLYMASGEQGISLDAAEDENDYLPIDGFMITLSPFSTKQPISDEINHHLNTLRKFHDEVEYTLTSHSKDNSVTVTFDFPAEIKIPCEQYLLYFAQFLKDLGVEADTALTHDAGQVLFTVTPDDKQQALDKIRAALEVYLHLPSSPVSDTQQSEIAVLRLNAELQNFQSKLSLARAEIQMKEAAIQLQQVTIAQLTGEVVIDSLKDVTPKAKDKDKEELLGDIVSLVPLKGKGVEINLPELLRKLKQMFKDKE